MNKFKFLLFLLLGAILAPAFAQQQIPQLPIDKDVRYGKLPNGLTYYIRHNALPANRANFYIAQKVGSVQEDDSQRGLAHFLEHMCFNGTDNFPGNKLIAYLESIGVKFGEDLNAYTATDETVYNIDNVPVTAGSVDSCLLILRDWADGLTLDPKEIDKERGVIHEEWRMRSSASQRMFNRNLPALYPGSKYGQRMPIGLMEIIDNFKPEALRAYYEKWYRPDLQGIIIVGDIDAAKMEAKVKELFSGVKMPKNAAVYETYPVPANNEPIYVIDKDKEQQSPVIQMMFKHDPIPVEMRNTVAYIGYNLIKSVSCAALNARLNELSQKPDCPFVLAMCDDGEYIMSKTMDALSLILIPKDGKDAEAVKAAYEELERARQFGITATEAIRAREEFMSNMEKVYNNRDKQKNDFYVQQYVQHFLDNLPIPSTEDEYNMYKMLSSQLPAEAYSSFFKEAVPSIDTNFVFMAFYPEKEGVKLPTVDQMKKAVAEAQKAKIEAYVDNVKNEPLIAQLPKKGSVVKETKADYGYTCWTLSNGARLFFKKTDFNNSQVLMNASSFGGKLKIDDKNWENAQMMDEIINSCGVGNFTSVELEKKLAGKQVQLGVATGDYTDNLQGSSTPKDLRTLFEMAYLRFQKPMNDVDAFNNYMALAKTSLENADKNPMSAFSDSISATLYNHNPLKRSFKLKDLAKVNFETIKKLYSERYNSPSDFDFFVTGNFDTDSLKLYAEQYLASIPSAGKREAVSKRVIAMRKGKVENRFRRDMETPQSYILRVYNGSEPYTLQNSVVVDALGQVLTQRYLKSIREDGGMAYSVSANASLSFMPTDRYVMQIICPMKPAKCDSVLLLMDKGIEDIAKSGVKADELDKVKKFELKTFADNQKENSYWQDLISDKVMYGKDEAKDYEKFINQLSSDDLKKFAKDVVLKQNNCATIIMLPADESEAPKK